MGKPKKATKKFLKTKLKDELERRKKFKDSTKHMRKRKAAASAAEADAPADDVEGGDSSDEGSDDGDMGFGKFDAPATVAIDPFGKGSDSDSDADGGDDGEDEDDEDVDDDDGDDDDIENMEDDEFDDFEGGVNDDEDEEMDGASDEEGDEFLSHKQQLELLKKQDPKFYQYLQENDQSLLNFGGSDDEDDDEGDEADEQGGDAGEDEEEDDEDDGAILVTPRMVKDWRGALIQHKSVRTLHKVLLAFRAAVAMGESDPEGEFRFRVEEGKVFNTVVVLALKYSPIVFNHVLYGPESEGRPRKGLPSGTKKWSRVQKLVKAYLTTTLKFVRQTTDRSMVAFVLRQCEAGAAYFGCFPKAAKDFMREMLGMWSGAEHEQIRILAFLCIRRLAIAAPKPHLQAAIKGSYSEFLVAAKTTTVHTWTQIQFMGNCVVELLGIHVATTYQLAFVYVRQLAMQLRAAVVGKTKEPLRAVFSWPFVHAARLWARMLGTYCDKTQAESKEAETLQPLIYPLVQIMTGAVRIKPSPKYFPFRLQLTKALIELMDKTDTFIPVASYLFDVLHSGEVTGKSKASTQRPLDLALTIKAPNGYLGTRPYQRGLLDETVHQLFEYYTTQARSISFPELAIPAIIELRRIGKGSGDVHVSKTLQQVVEKLEQNARFVEGRRAQVDFGPRDVARVREFLGDAGAEDTPLGKHNAARRRMRARAAPQDLAVPDAADGSGSESDGGAGASASASAAGGKRARAGAAAAAAAAAAASAPAAAAAGGGSDADDVVEDFALSDDDE